MQAEVGKAKLRANGIECFIDSTDTEGMLPHIDFLGASLVVHDEDFEKARDLLQEEGE